MRRCRISTDWVPYEEQEQIEFVEWLEEKKEEWEIVRFTAIPNSTRTPYRGEKMKMVRQGLRAWLPDLFVIYKNRMWKQRSVFVEMKRQKNGSVSAEQKERIVEINSTDGLQAIVCKGAAKAIEALQALMDE